MPLSSFDFRQKIALKKAEMTLQFVLFVAYEDEKMFMNNWSLKLNIIKYVHYDPANSVSTHSNLKYNLLFFRSSNYECNQYRYDRYFFVINLCFQSMISFKLDP